MSSITSSSTPSSTKSIGSQLYDDSASLGRFYTTMGVVIAIIICIGLVIFGIVLIVRKNKYTKIVKGTIKTAKCTMNAVPANNNNNNNNNRYSCTLKIDYYVNNKKYTNIFYLNSSRSYLVGSKINVHYIPENPTESVLTIQSPRLIGFVLIGIGILAVVGALISYYIAHRWKFAASATAVTDIIRNV